MLNLTRKKNEAIIIEVNGEIISINVTHINIGTGKKQVQLGIEAPRHFKVWREEIYESILENEKAAVKQIKPSSLKNLFSLKNKIGFK